MLLFFGMSKNRCISVYPYHTTKFSSQNFPAQAQSAKVFDRGSAAASTAALAEAHRKCIRFARMTGSLVVDMVLATKLEPQGACRERHDACQIEIVYQQPELRTDAQGKEPAPRTDAVPLGWTVQKWLDTRTAPAYEDHRGASSDWTHRPNADWFDELPGAGSRACRQLALEETADDADSAIQSWEQVQPCSLTTGGRSCASCACVGRLYRPKMLRYVFVRSCGSVWNETPHLFLLCVSHAQHGHLDTEPVRCLH